MQIFRIVTILCLLLLPNAAHAVLKIDITRGTTDPMPIAIPDFDADIAESLVLGREIVKVISGDLERSGLFAPIDRRAYIAKVLHSEDIPTFANWRQINAQALVTGSVTEQPDGKLLVAFRLWDVLSEKQFAGKSFTTNRENWRRISHMIADEIYRRLTGEDGYFDSRIVYIAESGSRRKRTKRLAIMDQDGANHQYLSGGRDLVLTPRFSPNSQKIIYMAYHSRIPAVYVYDLETGREERLGNFPGMSFAPRFSADGEKVIMSVSVNGNSEIFEMDLVTKTTRRITFDAAIDTSPSYSPDGERIVFNSDRGGSQQLYIMDADGGDVERISFGKGNYGTPVWSPRGDWVAFTKMHKGSFYIGVMRPDGSGERLITESFLDEGPTWSPNGRVIMFMRQTADRSGRPGTVYLYSIDITGHNERRVKTPGEASDPAWSPLLR